jgi:hypothetical protein
MSPGAASFRAGLRRHKERWFLVLVFAVSRVAFWWLGVRFDASPIPFFMQYLDPRILRGDLARGTYWLHSQPPMMNVVIGVALKMGPAAKPVLWALFVALSLYGVLALYGLLRALRLGRRVSVAVAFVFALSPALVLYENWLFYALPTAVGCTVVASSLARLIRRPRRRDGLILIGAATALAWTWGVFHLVWLAALVVVVVVRTKRARSVVLVGALALVATVALYAKNAVIAGHFAPSSWAGMNLYRVASAGVPRKEVARVVAEARVPRLVLQPPFAPISSYRDARLSAGCLRGSHRAICAEKKHGGHVNYNHIGYARLSNDYADAASALIVAYPGAYADSVGLAAVRFWNPPSDTSFVGSNRKRIRRYADAFTVFPNFAFGEPTGSPSDGRQKLERRVTWGPSAIVALAAGLVVVGLLRRKASIRRGVAPVVAPLFVFGWFFVVSSLFEIGENERFRFTVEPLIFALVAWAIVVVARAVASRFGRLGVRRPAR